MSASNAEDLLRLHSIDVEFVYYTRHALFIDVSNYELSSGRM